MSDPLADDRDMQRLARLYFEGRLDGSSLDDFEERLGNDQNARDALANVVRQCHIAAGRSVPEPSRRYRHQVRQRLAGSKSSFHPVAWSLMGAAAASVCFLCVGHSDYENCVQPETQSAAETAVQAEPMKNMDIRELERKVDRAESEFREMRAELARAREQVAAQSKARFEKNLDQSGKPRG